MKVFKSIPKTSKEDEAWHSISENVGMKMKAGKKSGDHNAIQKRGPYAKENDICVVCDEDEHDNCPSLGIVPSLFLFSPVSTSHQPCWDNPQHHP
mmetsp:Transcript_3171/g.7018  ORF Transcript_3171/g.7018 Transcript_3171/m.7018 type:complete len:95 (-) Transcript_3171:794-1078(-)